MDKSKEDDADSLSLIKLIQSKIEKDLTDKDRSVLFSFLARRYSEDLKNCLLQNRVSGLYAFVVPFHKVMVFTKDGRISKYDWCVVKLGQSTKGLVTRIIQQSRQYVTKRAWVAPVIPGNGGKEEKMSLKEMKEKFKYSEDLAEYIRGNINIYKDMVFVSPGLVADEDNMRNNIGIQIGKWKLQKDCLKNFFDGDFDHSGVVYDDGTIKAGGGWKIWMTERKYSQGVASWSPGPQEYFLMRKKDIHICRKKFLQGHNLRDISINCVKQYSTRKCKPQMCKIFRSVNDKKPLVLLDHGRK